MPGARGLLAKFTGGTIGGAASYAAGGATSRVLTPGLQSLENEAWKRNAVVPPDAYVLAEGVAQGQVDPKAAHAWAAEQGIGTAQFAALVSIANSGPGLSAALELWRRNLIGEAAFRRALKRMGLEPEWIDGLVQIKGRLLDVADLARAIHRGLIPDPGLLQGDLPQSEGNVPAYPVYPIDAKQSAAGHGYSLDELGTLVGLQGNPMGAHEAAQATFRGILTPDDYLRAVAEGNTRNEWAHAIFEQSKQIPTARDFIENALRGYRTFDDALAGAARHGMSEADATVIYQNAGRPMNIRQITQALARGAKFNPEPGEIPDPYLASIVEGPVKPGYYELAESLKYVYPAFFQTLNALKNGWIDEATATQWMLYQGYEPGAVDAIVSNVAKLAGNTATAAVPPEVKSQQTKLLATLRTAYVKDGADAGDVTKALEAVPYPHSLIDGLFHVWNIERAFEHGQQPPAAGAAA
jgi:hypothetical protein